MWGGLNDTQIRVAFNPGNTHFTQPLIANSRFGRKLLRPTPFHTRAIFPRFRWSRTITVTEGVVKFAAPHLHTVHTWYAQYTTALLQLFSSPSFSSCTSERRARPDWEAPLQCSTCGGGVVWGKQGVG